MSKAQDLFKHALEVIPYGTQLQSKHPNSFAPGKWPTYFTKAKGCEVWDIDGNHYYDFTSNGIGACPLGFADPDVSKAVIDRIENGSMSTLNPPEEVELADKLCEIHPWASKVRFARTGGEIAAVAVRTARATTGRDIVAICGYHGWTDWYLAANLSDDSELEFKGFNPLGVPQALSNTTFAFNEGDTDAVDKIIEKYGDRLACVVMEPMRSSGNNKEFLQYVREATKKVGAILIFDEITIGWRYCFGGSHKAIGVTPDMAIFAKAMGNGHPIAAVIGTAEAMEGAERSFISSTYWTESVGPVAALATIKKMEETKVWENIARAGEAVQKAWNEAGKKYNIPMVADAVPCLAHLWFEKYSRELNTLYTVLMLERGFLGAPAFYPTLAHTPEIVDKYVAAIDEVFAIIGEVLKKDDVEEIKRLTDGTVVQQGFGRLVK